MTLFLKLPSKIENNYFFARPKSEELLSLKLWPLQEFWTIFIEKIQKNSIRGHFLIKF